MTRTAMILCLAATLLVACGANVDPEAPLTEYTFEERGVQFVEPEVLKAWMEGGNADQVVIVDNRSRFSYNQRRIEDARSLPASDVEQSIGSFPLNKWLIMYCT